MKYIKLYEDYVNNINFTLNKETIMFINDELSESQFTDYMLNDIRNENFINTVKNTISDFATTIKNKVENIFITFVLNAIKSGNFLMTKFIAICNNIMIIIKNFEKNHPTAFKIIIGAILVAIILLLTSQSAHAAEYTNGKMMTSGSEQYEAVAGFLRQNDQVFRNTFDDNSVDQVYKVLKIGQTQSADVVHNMTPYAKLLLKTVTDQFTNLQNKANSGDFDAVSKLFKFIQDGHEQLKVVINDTSVFK